MIKQLPFIQDKKITTKEFIIAVLTFLITLLVIRYRGFSNTLYLGGTIGDAGLYVWLFDFNLRQLFSEGWFNTSTLIPYSRTLAWSDNFILPSICGKVLTSLGISKILAYNLTLLSSTFLNGFCCWLLSSKLSGKALLSITAGLIFMSYSFFTANLGHPQLQFAFYIPLTIYLTFLYFEKKKFYLTFLSGLTVFACFLTTVYYAVFCLIFLTLIYFCTFILRPKFFTKTVLKHIILTSILIGLIFIPFVKPYFEVSHTFGSRYLSEPYAFAVGGLSYFGNSILNFVPAEKQLFAGLVLIFLTLAAIWRLKIIPQKKFLWLCFLLITINLVFSFLLPSSSRSLNLFISFLSWLSLILLTYYGYLLGKIERKHQIFYLTNRSIIFIFIFSAYFFFLLTLGPLGDTSPNKHEAAYGVFSFFFKFFPGLNCIRDISRFGVNVILALSILIPFTLNKVKLKNKVFLFSFLIFFENFSSIYPVEPAVTLPDNLRKLASLQDKNDITIFLPLTTKLKPDGTIKSWSDFAINNVNYMNMASTFNIKLFNGYSGIVTKLMRDYPRKMANFPDERSLIALSTISGLRFILFNKNLEPTYNSQQFDIRLKHYQDYLIYHGEDNEGWKLFELKKLFIPKNSFFLQVPINSNLNLKIKCPSKKCEIDFFYEIKKQDKLEKKYLTTISVNRSVEKFSIPMPESYTYISPFLLSFKEKHDKTFFIKKNNFIRR